MKQKKVLTLNVSFIDKYTGEFLGNNLDEFIHKIPEERQVRFKALLLELKTGKVHVEEKRSKP